MSDALREMADRLLPAISQDRRGDAEALKALSLAALADDEPSAIFTRFDDGSSRVLVTDGLVGMLRLLADLTALWFYEAGGRGWVGAFRRIRAIQTLQGDERRLPVLAAALRWNLIHRRIWGQAATLAAEPEAADAISLRDMCSQVAWTFVVAHECGHCVLGHSAEDTGNWQAEFAADSVAFAATCAFHDVAEGPTVVPFVLIGARLAFLAAEVIERALFVRPPTHHPSSAERWNALGAELGQPPELLKAELVTAGIDEAVRRVVDPRFALPATWWTTAYADKHVHCDVHEPAYYEHFSVIDRLSFGDPEDPARYLSRVPVEEGRAMLDAAFAARDGDLRAGLKKLGIDEASTSSAADKDIPLSVLALVELIYDSPVVSAIADSHSRRMVTIAASTLMAGVERGVL